MEITLFNKNGRPVAYIADDGESIYLWDGRPVAYIVDDQVYDWNGRQVGWFTNGTVFDIYGLRSGFIKTKSPIATEVEPIKPHKHLKPVKGKKQSQVIKPILCYGYSTKNLEDILDLAGKH
ncbi:MAG: 4-fold beta flower protein [Desulfobaccales bacterium]